MSELNSGPTPMEFFYILGLLHSRSIRRKKRFRDILDPFLLTVRNSSVIPVPRQGLIKLTEDQGPYLGKYLVSLSTLKRRKSSYLPFKSPQNLQIIFT